ncbi:MAG: HEPN domain-containing protein [Ferruginibacter sp.]
MSGTPNDYIEYRINKSKETLADAILLSENERWNSAVNRLYYSTLYLVSALIPQKGNKAQSHGGTKTQFNLHFIKSGLLSLEHGKLYANLFDWR